jgi:hypothetical protein
VTGIDNITSLGQGHFPYTPFNLFPYIIRGLERIRQYKLAVYTAVETYPVPIPRLEVFKVIAGLAGIPYIGAYFAQVTKDRFNNKVFDRKEEMKAP